MLAKSSSTSQARQRSASDHNCSKPEDIADMIAGALDIAQGECGGGFNHTEMEVFGNEIVITPKDLKRKFKVTVEMYYE